MINIISNINQQNIQVSSKRPQHTAYDRSLKCDTVSFCSKNLLSKPSAEITKKVLAAVNDADSYIGEGIEGKAYKIKDSGYCVKVLNRTRDIPFGEWNLNISPEHRVNHVVARAENGATIMKYIEGKQLTFGENPKEVYSLPKESYRKILKQIHDAHKLYMEYDGAPANVIYNSKEKTLTAIDFLPCINVSEYTPFASLFSTLKHDKRNPGNELDNSLTGKLLNVALDELSKGKEQEIPVEKEDMIEFFRDVENSYSGDKNSGENIFPPQYKFLKKAFNEIFQLKQYERRGYSVEDDMAGKIKYARCIVNQIFPPAPDNNNLFIRCIRTILS